MGKPEDLIKELEKPDTEEIMKKIVRENIEKENKKKDRIRTLMSNLDYIKWLIEFTKNRKGFSDDDWDYSSEKLDDANQWKVNDLQLFFEGIYQYARKNYIYSQFRPLGECYQIKIDDIGFEIGYLSGQGTKFYCERMSLEEMENAIDFMDIVNNKKQDNVEYIEKSLEYLSNMFIELYERGVPIEAIVETFNRTIKDITQKEHIINEQKRLKKNFN